MVLLVGPFTRGPVVHGGLENPVNQRTRRVPRRSTQPVHGEGVTPC